MIFLKAGNERPRTTFGSDPLLVDSAFADFCALEDELVHIRRSEAIFTIVPGGTLRSW